MLGLIASDVPDNPHTATLSYWLIMHQDSHKRIIVEQAVTSNSSKWHAHTHSHVVMSLCEDSAAVAAG